MDEKNNAPQNAAPSLSDYPQTEYRPQQTAQEALHSDELNGALPVDQPLSEEQIVPEPQDEGFIRWSTTGRSNKQRGALWYVGSFLIAVCLIMIDIFIIKSFTFSAVVAVMYIALIVYLRTPSPEVTYTISEEQGVYVGESLHPFSEFRAFSIIDSDNTLVMYLLPVKRLALGVNIPLTEEVYDSVLQLISSRLPAEGVKEDFVDVIIRKLKL